MEQNKKFTIQIYVIFIVIILLLVFAIIKITGEGGECMRVPMNYGIRQMEEGAMPGTVRCECHALDSEDVLILTHNRTHIQKFGNPAIPDFLLP